MKMFRGFWLLVMVGFGCVAPKARKPLQELNQANLAVQKQFDSLLSNQPDWQWMEAKFNADIRVGDERFSAKGRLRMRNDSLIWLSIKPDIAIIEVFRIIIVNDTAQVLDLLNKKYYSGSVRQATSWLGPESSLAELQNIIWGYPFLIYPKENFSSYLADKEAVLSTFGSLEEPSLPNIDGQRLRFFGLGRLSQSLIVRAAEQQRIRMEFTGYHPIEKQLWPGKIEISTRANAKDIRISLDMQRVQLQGPLDFPFTVPDAYPRFNLSQFGGK